MNKPFRYGNGLFFSALAARGLFLDLGKKFMYNTNIFHSFGGIL